MAGFKKVTHPKCPENPLTAVTSDPTTQEPHLYLFHNLTKKYDHEKFSCCYSEILRSGSGGSADKKFNSGFPLCVPSRIVSYHFAKTGSGEYPMWYAILYDNSYDQLPITYFKNGMPSVMVRVLSCDALGSRHRCVVFHEIAGTGKTSTCINFNSTIKLGLHLDSILVNCWDGKTKVYTDIHVLVSKKEAINKRLQKWKELEPGPKKPISVILFGIDSMSRMNLIRVMPKTAKYVKDTGWFDMAGYNKMADNTFPNLMAVLTGYNTTSAQNICKPKKTGGLDACPFVWYDYRRAGYVTAYAEDQQPINTFNYLKVGFEKPPTDYYLRPAMLAAEKNLKNTKLSGLIFCLGYKSQAEYIYDYALQTKNAYRNDPFFGLFWTNSFSHNAYDSASSMDEKILDYLETFNATNILDDSVVVFFSDHGMRFGSLRQAPTGHLEERLPFLHLWVPTRLQDEHPEFVDALRINKHRLTTPYDLHMTLKHILELSGRVKSLGGAPDCPICQSLFQPIPESRSCEDVAIEDHWCTCRAFHNVDKNSDKVKTVIHRTIEYINDLVKTANNGSVAHLCQTLVLKKLFFANQEVLPHEPANTTVEGYQLMFETNPGSARFETTVRLDTLGGKFTVTGTISRLNSYEKQAKCVKVEAVKKFCACKS